jgi:16S rRNA (uracil1498-N3)-methyltransferase
MPFRFHAPAACGPGERVTLPEGEGEHLTRVLRLGPGARVRLFNGRGDEFHAEVLDAANAAVVVRTLERCQAAPEPRVAITLAQAVLKGEKMDGVIRDAVMLGVAAVQPIVSARTAISAAALARSGRRERWQRVAIASAKQCGRAVVPAVLDACALDQAGPWGDATGQGAPAFMFVEPGAASTAGSVGELDSTPPPAATILAGPEGGWTPAEIGRGARTARLVTLGSRTLRAEAVALVAISVLMARWGEF